MTTVLDRLQQLVHTAVEYGRLAGRKEFGPLSREGDVALASRAGESLALAQRLARELQFKEPPTVTAREVEGMDSTMQPLEANKP
jgi:hypothetical protein